MEMICKFVVKDGKIIGESIDVFENNLIVKSGSDFIGIPLESVVEVDKERITVKDFDESLAKEVGKKWMVEKSKPVSLEELEKMGL
ncbi:DUF5749 family beta-barrel protein [Archaeoglobus profundus]|uniref:PRC-barrel domain-containing protein n=1 Tax=Archaeoglobus profundus (strain DSM 5631 / JCM 9629 / NBRC 100127 / Av18) TaxID=572546 RepID=D2RF61_ARCPA|nr:DUF5749 family beta-barrel protein [Archaeoglobus profundus]ADB58755.1 hypothetical protein Arcpr_1710 [Archaeoglobus profundus DSM 5631]